MEPMINIALRAARKAGENIVRASDDLDRIDSAFTALKNSTGLKLVKRKKVALKQPGLDEKQSGRGRHFDSVWPSAHLI